MEIVDILTQLTFERVGELAEADQNGRKKILLRHRTNSFRMYIYPSSGDGNSPQ